MPNTPIKVLVVEDDPADTKLLLRALANAGIESTVVRVETEPEYRRELSAEPDVILCDYNLPQFDAMRALKIKREIAPAIPFLIVSGSIGEETAVEAIKCGATDYLLKDRLGRLGSAVSLAIEQRKLRDGERQALEALRRNEEQFRGAFDDTGVAMVLTDIDNRFVRVNAAFGSMFGYAASDMVGMTMAGVTHPDDVAESLANRVSLLARERTFFQIEKRYRHRDGRTLWGLTNVSLVRDSAGRPFQYVGQVQDITDRKRAEDAVRAGEERFRAFMDNSPSVVTIKCEAGRYVYANPTWRRQFDPEPADWLGKTDFDFWPRETAELFRASDAACLARNGVVQLEETGRTAAGELVTWLVMKFPLQDGADRRVGVIAWDITDRKRSEEELQLRDRAIRATTQGIVITDSTRPDNPVVYVSPAFEAMSGYSSAEVVGRNCRFMQGPHTDPAAVLRIRETLQTEDGCKLEILNYRKDGTTFWNELSISPVRDAEGRLTHCVGTQSDITGRKLLESQYRQSQKMEAVGQLAGGIAHDFNNLLTIINGYSELLLQDLRPGDSTRDLLVEIHKAGTRSAGLTRQLLAFSRQQVLTPRLLDLNEIAEETEKMLRRVIGEDILLVTSLAPDLGKVRADAGQIEQVLLNLSVNARDAMPKGGRLLIETRNVELGRTHTLANPEVAPGSYVLLAISDTGTGMSPEVKAKIFEPFFTTKGPGQGTGLGLATVYGIVRQSAGHLDVFSAVGSGTSFHIYLPRVEGALAEKPSKSGLQPPPRGTETILLVEDEDGVRALTRHVLAACGYTVLDVVDGHEALMLADTQTGPIDLLITDVVMPGLGGPEVAEQISRRFPGIRILFVSGYTDDAVIRHGLSQQGVNFLQKPFSPPELAAKVRDVLDASA